MRISVQLRFLATITTLLVVPKLMVAAYVVPMALCRTRHTSFLTAAASTGDEYDEDEEEAEYQAFLKAEAMAKVDAYNALDPEEKVWRYAKKPLLSIGAKGATPSHGNSLRQLLDDHTVVKVKMNTKAYGK